MLIDWIKKTGATTIKRHEQGHHSEKSDTREWPEDGLIFSQFLRCEKEELPDPFHVTMTGGTPPPQQVSGIPVPDQ